MSIYKNQLQELEDEGYEHEGAYLACPASGEDHQLELWVHPNNRDYVVEVCPHCQTVHRP